MLDVLNNENDKQKQELNRNPFLDDRAAINNIDARLQKLSKAGKKKGDGRMLSKLSKKILKRDPVLANTKLEIAVLQDLLQNLRMTSNG